MGATVEQYTNYFIFAASNDDWLTADATSEVVAFFRDLTVMTDEDPCVLEQRSHFQIENSWIGVERSMNSIMLNKRSNIDRCCAIHLCCHLCQPFTAVLMMRGMFWAPTRTNSRRTSVPGAIGVSETVLVDTMMRCPEFSDTSMTG